MLRKRTAILVVCILMLAVMLSSFTACDTLFGKPGNNDNNAHDNVDKDTEQEQETTYDDWFSETANLGSIAYVKAFIEKIGLGNYSCKNYVGDKVEEYKFNGDKKYSKIDNKEIIYDKVENLFFTYEINSTDNKYHKVITNATIDDKALIYNDFARIYWNEFTHEKVDGVDQPKYDGVYNNVHMYIEVKPGGKYIITYGEKKLEIYDVGTTVVDIPAEDQVVDDTVNMEILNKSIDEIVDKLLLGNFTYLQSGAGYRKVRVADDKVTNSTRDKYEDIYVSDGEYNYLYKDAYLSKDNSGNDMLNYNRYYAPEPYDVNSVIYNDMKSATWTDYDPFTATFTGKFNSKSATLQLVEDGFTVKVGNMTIKVTEIGKTKIRLPRTSRYSDYTYGDYIFSVPTSNSDYRFKKTNIDLVTRKVFEWIKSGNPTGADLVTRANPDEKLEQGLYVQEKGTSLCFTGIVDNKGKKIVRTYLIDNYDLFEAVYNNGPGYQEMVNLDNALATVTPSQFKLYSFRYKDYTFDLDYMIDYINYDETKKSEFHKLSMAVKDQLTTKGWGSHGAVTMDSFVFLDAGLVTKMTSDNNAELGQFMTFEQWMLVRDDKDVNGNKYKVLKVKVNAKGATEAEALETIYAGRDNWNIETYENGATTDQGIETILSKVRA